MSGLRKSGITTRAGVVLVVGLLGVAGLAGCGRIGQNAGASAGSSSDAGDTTPMTVESQALEALGFEVADLEPVDAVAGSEAELAPTTSAPTASAAPGKGKGHPGNRRLYKRLRLAFGKRALHGEVVVQTDNGTRTLVAQRGEVTAITATTVTVKSTDGYTLTWTFADKFHVFEHRTQIKAEDIKAGTVVGVAGFKDGDKPMARVLVVPNKAK